MTKKQLLEIIKDAPDDTTIFLGVKEELIQEVKLSVNVISGLNIKLTSIYIK